MPVYRVLVVDDSRFMRKVIGDMVDADEAFTVIATASDGEEAVKAALEHAPDIITMDLEMPRMNGLEALKRIMAVRPTPVVMLSAVTDNGTRNTIRALQWGAFDFVRKPDNAVSLDAAEVGAYLLEKLRTAADAVGKGPFRMLSAVKETPASEPPVSLASALLEEPLLVQGPEMPIPGPSVPVLPDPPQPPVPPARLAAGTKTAAAEPPAARRAVFAESPAAGRKKAEAKVPAQPPAKQRKERSAPITEIVALGTSTGGPRALHEVLTKLPSDFGAPVLVVQHMPPRFTHSLAQRLDAFCAIRVREAAQDEAVKPGTAYIAPGGKQMSLARSASGVFRIKLTDEGPRNGHMPSVDTLFESLVGLRELKRHTVLMTGMGSDGAKGMKALQEDGAETRIAESEETCVVYGMPRSAVEAGAVTHILPLQQIASVLLQEVKSRH